MIRRRRRCCSSAFVGPALLVSPLWERWTARFGKRSGYLASTVVLAVGTLTFWTAAGGTVWLAYLAAGIAGVGYAGTQVCPLAMLPDVTSEAIRDDRRQPHRRLHRALDGGRDARARAGARAVRAGAGRRRVRGLDRRRHRAVARGAGRDRRRVVVRPCGADRAEPRAAARLLTRREDDAMPDVLARLEALRAGDLPTHGGRTLAYVYDSGLADADEIGPRALASFGATNGLDPTAFPSLAAMERDLVAFARPAVPRARRRRRHRDLGRDRVDPARRADRPRRAARRPTGDGRADDGARRVPQGGALLRGRAGGRRRRSADHARGARRDGRGDGLGRRAAGAGGGVDAVLRARGDRSGRGDRRCGRRARRALPRRRVHRGLGAAVERIRRAVGLRRARRDQPVGRPAQVRLHAEGRVAAAAPRSRRSAGRSSSPAPTGRATRCSTPPCSRRARADRWRPRGRSRSTSAPTATARSSRTTLDATRALADAVRATDHLHLAARARFVAPGRGHRRRARRLHPERRDGGARLVRAAADGVPRAARHAPPDGVRRDRERRRRLRGGAAGVRRRVRGRRPGGRRSRAAGRRGGARSRDAGRRRVRRSPRDRRARWRGNRVGPEAHGAGQRAARRGPTPAAGGAPDRVPGPPDPLTGYAGSSSDSAVPARRCGEVRNSPKLTPAARASPMPSATVTVTRPSATPSTASW